VAGHDADWILERAIVAVNFPIGASSGMRVQFGITLLVATHIARKPLHNCLLLALLLLLLPL
jgi:hypothetical protein